MSRKSLLNLLSLPGLLALLLVAFIAFGARDGAKADPVQTGGTVGGEGALPVVECAWILPDATTTATNPQTMEYGNDDDPATPSGPPCDSNGSGPATMTNQPATNPMVHIKPNPEDQPNTQLVELWGAIDPPAGTASDWPNAPYWDVYHPDGSLKVQVHGTKITPQGDGHCGDPTGPISTALNSMFTAAGPGAGNTGQLSSNAVASMKSLCQQNGKALYYARFELHKYQPCGNYRVVFTATGGATNVTLEFYFVVPCIQQLKVDFSSVDWKTLTPGQTTIAHGDLVFANPACVAMPLPTTCPTVKNVGNSGMGIVVTYSDLVQCSDAPTQACPDPTPPPQPKRITDFDACFGRGAAAPALQCIDPQPAAGSPCQYGDARPECNNKVFEFDTARDRTLCANELGKLDLSVHPPFGLSAGNYQGTVLVTGVSHVAQQYCGENGAEEGGNLPGSG